MSDSTSAKVIPWKSGPLPAEYVSVGGMLWLKPIAPVDCAAVWEAEAAGKLKFFSEQVRQHWERTSTRK